ncbi:S-adenosyl-L-methionine-dependent methyltransferase [Xylaria intraflava]|nr:S-adenosyl-L-methionine-dependent methyltransferase [Xylaria intraflava]
MTSQHQKPGEPSSGSNVDPGTTSADEEPPYIEALGHKYHGSGQIFIPFDEKEQRRMELQHRMTRICLNGALTTTRIPLDVKQIVDLGTGTGLWALEMAARYPQAEILGIDISRIQKTTAIPPNVKFAINNVEHPWPTPADSIDFLHIRGLSGGVRDWPAVFKQAYEKLKPGGLFEWTEIAIQVFDFNGKFRDDVICPKFLSVWRDLSKRYDVDFNPWTNAPVWLVEAGFENIVQRNEILPLGDWAQDEKLRTRQVLMNEIAQKHMSNHCGLLFTKSGWTQEQFDEFEPTFLRDVYAETTKPYTAL